MTRVYILALISLITIASLAQTTSPTPATKTTTTPAKTVTKTSKTKAKKTVIKTSKSSATSNGKTAINQPTSTPSTKTGQSSGTAVGRGGATTTTPSDNTPTNTNTTNPTTTVTQSDAGTALRDALSSGITDAVSKTSAVDGFLNNSEIKIPFPQDAAVIQTTLNSIGLGSLTDNVVASLNHAAENAAVQATPIFLGSIKQLTFTDAINIVDNSQPDAATQFLQRTTTEQLVAAFKPSIKTALDNANATKYWSTVMDEYNKIPFVQHIETDLPDYVTRKAVSGLFIMVAKEEAAIRRNPSAATSPMVKKVFGTVLENKHAVIIKK